MGFFRALIFLLFILHSAVSLVSSQRLSNNNNNTSSWKTLTGNSPIVIARAGFSGAFPPSSRMAYEVALSTSLPDVVLWCDVQLTKDGVGICLPDMNLNNSTNIGFGDLNVTETTYLVNGVSMPGFFSLDFTAEFLLNKVSLARDILSRNPFFDEEYGILTVENVSSILSAEDAATASKRPGLWLNIQHDAFFAQHNLSMRSYVLSVSRNVIVNYISSPEVGFLRGIAARFMTSKTKLVFRFLDAEATEPSTNQTYSSLLKNLTFVKTFASGILVPKSYIWPVNALNYLQPHTSVVSDAHKAGLEIFASDFANDASFSYNYSHNPVSEYLSFIDNGDFTVDGLLSDYPITSSAAIDCFSHLSKNSSERVKLDVVSHNGASGMFPGSTDLAYKQAIEDGSDYIDCSVQMTKDGIPFCLRSINLVKSTTVVQSKFTPLSITIPEIQSEAGIFTFNLTWEDIQTLKPQISRPYPDFSVLRNPAYKNEGSFVSLADFLTLSVSKPLAGIVITIENAAYLAEKVGLSITDAVLDALAKSGYNNQTAQKVVIQSTNKSVLTKFKKQSKYKIMYMVDEDIRSATNSSMADIKSFADIVSISKNSIFPQNYNLLIGATDVVSRLQSFNLSVYVHNLMNEFVSHAWDFFGDPIVEINSYVIKASVNGVVTDFPGTAVQYKRNRCLDNDPPPYMLPVSAGGLVEILSPEAMPPAEAPYPVLTDSNVTEPPLPPVSDITDPNGTSASGPTSPSSDGHRFKVSCVFWSLLLLFGHLFC